MTRKGGWPTSGFGAILARLRKKAGLSQQQLADQTGCGLATVAKLERGAHEPAWPLVLAFAHVLGVGVEVFARQEQSAEPLPKRKRGRPRKDAG